MATFNLKKWIDKVLGCCYTTGTYNYWTWKKYADGTFELWADWTGAPSTGSHYVTVGNFYGYYSAGWTFPAGCKPINVKYSVQADWHIGNGFAVDGGCGGTKTTSTFNLYALSTASGQSSVDISVRVTGRWK